MPMVAAFVLLTLGILLFDTLHIPVHILAAAFILCCCCAAMPFFGHFRVPYLAAAILLLGGLSLSLGRRSADIPLRQPLYMEVELDEMPLPHREWVQTPARMVRWCDAEGGDFSGRVPVMVVSECLDISGCGDRLQCLGSIIPFDSEDDNPYAALMARRGYAGALFVQEENILSFRHGRGNGVRARIMRRLDRLGLSPLASAVVHSVSAGDSRNVSMALRKAYARCGVAHILAVSGLHVGIVFMLFNSLFNFFTALPCGNIIKNAAVLAAVWLYAFACGLPPSAVRAAAMFSVWQAVRTFSTKYSAVNALAAAAFAMTVVDPCLLYDASFRLSMIAVAAVVAWALRRPGIFSGGLLGRMLLGTAATCAVATVATLPLISNIFGIVSLAGIVITPLFVMAVYVIITAVSLSAVLPVGWLTILFAAVLDGVGDMLNNLIEWTSEVKSLCCEYRLSDAMLLPCYFVMGSGMMFLFAARGRCPNKELSLPA